MSAVTAAVRARRLVRQIEAAIEAGEFTPMNFGYLNTFSVYPGQPCGCAVGAAGFLGGVDPNVARRPFSGFDAVVHASVLSLDEAMSLEDGYEASDRRTSGATEFYKAGVELRKFHPSVSA
jgi:hypothetical protein